MDFGMDVFIPEDYVLRRRRANTSNNNSVHNADLGKAPPMQSTIPVSYYENFKDFGPAANLPTCCGQAFVRRLRVSNLPNVYHSSVPLLEWMNLI